jgi:hypothetical protein
LRVEIELGRRAGESLHPEEYDCRLPEHAAVIEAVFGPVSAGFATSGPGHDATTTAHVTTGEEAAGNGQPAPGTRVRYFGDYEIQK